MIPKHGYDFVQWNPSIRGLYESNYLKANSPDGRRGFWIKHNILSPKDKTRPAILELWCVLFDQDRGQPKALKQERPMSEVLCSKTSLRMEGDGVLLTATETQSQATDSQGKKASWKLSMTSLSDPFHYFWLDAFYTSGFPRQKLIVPAPRLCFNGTIDFEGYSVDVKDWIGSRGHNWGTVHTDPYAYGNCNLFEEDDSAILDAVSARIRYGKWRSPWISAGWMRLGGRELAFNQLHRLARHREKVDFPRWELDLNGPRRQSISTCWELDPQQCVGLRYLHPNGNLSFCYNTKFARVTARTGRTVLTSTQGELEFLFSKPVPGIPLHGTSELPAAT